MHCCAGMSVYTVIILFWVPLFHEKKNELKRPHAAAAIARTHSHIALLPPHHLFLSCAATLAINILS